MYLWVEMVYSLGGCLRQGNFKGMAADRKVTGGGFTVETFDLWLKGW